MPTDVVKYREAYDAHDLWDVKALGVRDLRRLYPRTSRITSPNGLRDAELIRVMWYPFVPIDVWDDIQADELFDNDGEPAWAFGHEAPSWHDEFVRWRQERYCHRHPESCS